MFVNCISYFCRSQTMMLSEPEYWEKIRVVHCGLDVNMFDTKRHKGQGQRLLFVGRLVPAKGVLFLLETVSRVDGAILDIAGDGPQRSFLERQALATGFAFWVIGLRGR